MPLLGCYISRGKNVRKSFAVSMIFLIVIPLLAVGIRPIAAMPVSDGGGGYSVRQVAVTSLSGFEGIDAFRYPFPTGIIAIDVEVAAGPDHVMEVWQKHGEIFSKQGTVLSNFPLTKLFNTWSCDGVGDSRVLFDTASQRWFIAAIHDDRTCDSPPQFVQHNADFAVSKTSDPSPPPDCLLCAATWKSYRAVAGSTTEGNLAGVDHPEIAVTDDKFVLTTQISGKMLVYNKNDIINLVGSPAKKDLTELIPSGTNGCSGQAQPYPVRSLSPTSRQYMVCLGNYNSAGDYFPIFLFYIDGTPSLTGSTSCCTVSETTQITAIRPSPGSFFRSATVPLTRDTENREYNTIQYADSISAVWSQGWLWFSTNAGCTFDDGSLRSCIRLTQISTSSLPSAFPSQDFYFKQQGVEIYLPALSLDSQRNLGLVFAYSSSTSYPSIGITGQDVGDPVGSLAPWKPIKVGSGYDQKNRFADYFGAATDPSDPTLIWVAGGYYPSMRCTTSLGDVPCWATWVASMQVVGLAMWSSPSTLRVYPGARADTTVNVRSLGSYSGSVTLTAGVSPANYLGPTASMSPSIQVTVGGTSTATATADATPVRYGGGGSYNLTVTAGIPGLSLMLPVPMEVPYYDASSNPSSLTFTPGTYGQQISQATFSSRLLFQGTVALSLSVPVGCPPCISATINPSGSISLTSGGTSTVAVTITVNQNSGTSKTGTWQVQVIGAYAYSSYSAIATILVNVGSPPPPPPPPGGGGSVRAGTQIRMADGSTMLVQNIQLGMQLSSFNPYTGSFYNATVNSIASKSVDNMYVIETNGGSPIRVDYWEQFWVQLPSGHTLWMVAGNIQPGYKILRPVEGMWATVTSNTLSIGSFTVYDLFISPTLPDGANPLIANGYLDMKQA